MAWQRVFMLYLSSANNQIFLSTVPLLGPQGVFLDLTLPPVHEEHMTKVWPTGCGTHFPSLMEETLNRLHQDLSLGRAWVSGRETLLLPANALQAGWKCALLVLAGASQREAEDPQKLWRLSGSCDPPTR